MRCPDCAGTGSKTRNPSFWKLLHPEDACPRCDGDGFYETENDCPYCGGRGEYAEDVLSHLQMVNCTDCWGSGLKKK